MDSDRQFTLDIRRTLVLGLFMKHWGMPDYRVVSRKDDNVVEVYSFPPVEEGAVHRVASVGLSGIKRENGQNAAWELYMALPQGLGGASFEQVSSFLLDVAVYSLRSDVGFQVGAVIPESLLVPSIWPPKAILLDEARGEPEEIEYFHVGPEHVDLIWVVPIYRQEYELIKASGLEVFDKLDEGAEWSLADPHRPSFV